MTKAPVPRGRLLAWALSACGLMLAADRPAVAEEPSPEKHDAIGLALFEAKVRPVLASNCYACHSAPAGKTEGGLRVDTKSGLRDGGHRGPAVVPGDPEASWLLKAIAHSDDDLRMPPKRDRLNKDVIADFELWIRLGAPDPRDGQTTAGKIVSGKIDYESARQFWSLRPVTDPPIPTSSDPGWARQPLDHFVLARLDDAGLAPSPDAKPSTLLRRLYFDLIGLPPTPAQQRAFLERIEADGVDAALVAEVDRLLALPQFGQRWGRHWLDVARFGESTGKVANISFPHAWRYRDWVIDAVSADMPYDRFITEQLAGDLLPYEDDAERARLLVATGFLALGTKNLEEMNAFQFLADVIDEQIDTVTQALMGNSVACARCHDHKFDPFTMEDYYALAGVFASTKTYFGTHVSPANQVGGDPLPLPHLPGELIFHPSISAEQVVKLKEQLAALQKEGEEGQAAVRRAIEAGEDPGDLFTLTDALRIFWTSGGIKGQLDRVDDQGRALPLAMGVLDREHPIDAPLLERGDIHQAGAPVPRGFPRVVALSYVPEIPENQSGRLQLARWLTQPDHPLTARVMVNRIWHHLFGAGLVSTVDNFGATGQPPSHPELLDYLARRFVERGWSVKQMVREIALSRTYRQASDFRPDAFQIDPDNRLLCRASKRRLDAEAIRDAMLAVSGELQLDRLEGSLVARIGDKPISLIGLDKKIPSDLDGSVHRSVYLPVIRDRLPDVLELFDFAEPGLVTGRRETTNVPVQALYLMNSPFVQARAAALASRLGKLEGDERRIRQAFALCYGRPPDAFERQRSAEFLAAAGNDRQQAETALASFCQALLAAAEFRNLD